MQGKCQSLNFILQSTSMTRFLLFLLLAPFFTQLSAQDLAEKYFLKGVEFQEKKIFSRALDYYNIALKENTNHTDARYNRAILFYQQEKYIKSLSDVQTLINSNPFDPELYSLSGLIYAQLNQSKKALYNIDRAIDIDNQPLFHLRKADILLQIGQPELAFNELSISANDPILQTTLLELTATAYIDLNQPNQAIGTYDKLIQLSPQAQYYYNRGLLLQKKEVQRACQDFSIASKEPFFVDAIDALVRCQWQLEQFDEVEKTCKNGIIHFPNNPTFYLYAGLASLKKGKNETAVHWLSKAQKLGLNSLEVHINKGLALISIDKDQARQCFERALIIDPNNVIAQHNLLSLEN